MGKATGYIMADYQLQHTSVKRSDVGAPLTR